MAQVTSSRQQRIYRADRRNALRTGKQGGISPNTLRRPNPDLTYLHSNMNNGSLVNMRLGDYIK